MTKKTFVALTLISLLIVPMRSRASSGIDLFDSYPIDTIKQVVETIKDNMGDIQTKIRDYTNMVKGPMNKVINMITQHSNRSFNSGHNSTNKK